MSQLPVLRFVLVFTVIIEFTALATYIRTVTRSLISPRSLLPRLASLIPPRPARFARRGIAEQYRMHLYKSLHSQSKFYESH